MKSNINNWDILVMVLTSVYKKMNDSVTKIHFDPNPILEGNNTWEGNGRKGGRIRGSIIATFEVDDKPQECQTRFNIGWNENGQGGTTVEGKVEITGASTRKFRFRTDDLTFGSVDEIT